MDVASAPTQSGLLFLLLLLTTPGNLQFSGRFNISGLDYDAEWGLPGDISSQDISIRPIRIEFNDTMLDDLINRLSTRTPVTPSYEGAWFDYGINSAVVENWANYWQKKYLFKYREHIINQYPHYLTNIQGLDVHFIWIRPQVPQNVEVIPILIQNGWPHSVVELYDAIPHLTRISPDRNFVLEIIAPTLPGFTLSEAPKRPGLSAPDIGVIYRNLMNRLGHKRYYLAGGDFGSIVCSAIATLFPEEVLGFHAITIVLLSTHARVPFEYKNIFRQTGNSVYSGNMTRGRTTEDHFKQNAYVDYQTTNPDTLGVGLNDSPVGLLAYILEKIHFGSVLERKENAGVQLERMIPIDRLLDNVMLYWITKSITTSMRLYPETLGPRGLAMGIDEIPSPVPTWITEAKYELSMFPIGFLRTKYPNLISYKSLDFGGHSLMYEYPQFYAEDVLAAITAFRRWHLTRNIKNEL